MFFATKSSSKSMVDTFRSTSHKPFTYGLIRGEDQEGSEQDYPSHQPVKRSSRDPFFLTAVLLLLVTSNLATFCFTRRFLAREPMSDQVQSDWQKEIDRTYHTKHDNGFEPYSAFTMNPNEYGDFPELRWWELGLYGPALLVPKEYAADFHLDPSIHLFYTPGQKGVPSDIKYEGFPVNIQMNHQLHCVNFLRQGLYFNHQYYRDSHHMTWNTTNEKALQIHLNHCVDSLRQHIMCNADARVLPYLTSTKGKFEDFTLPRKCRNWEDVRDFAKKHIWSATGGQEWLDDRHFMPDLDVDEERWPADRLWSGH
ncbi:unnamed protein product [Zymoseptoria tritici ST99CH_1A5]|uniref:Tat pathway signal sequence n=1 Tax=Zymoseptoria tritici ST99CH_1A5 TaxID=1276529 RepID=A0A1Y6LWE5_ZYMTR|nr:unnamed protein product [Zymoseptoria tritici ST99CH_1A5]